ncbi:LysR substrate-binding domain protein [Bordetella bronchiseptica MBORD731]|nr:LysR substrate-binding domain protein [Bordetella bronchiseptica MBORD731]
MRQTPRKGLPQPVPAAPTIPAMDNIDIKLLRTLLVLMSERSVSRTADRLDVSQPAVSHALARLRILFDDPLLLRSRAGMVPTDRASEIEARVRRLLAEYDALAHRPQPFDPSVSERHFVLSAPEYAEHLLMPPIFRHLRAHAPNIRVEVRAPDPERAYELLESGEVDLRIAWLRKPAQSLRSMQLFQDRIVCIADRDHPALDGTLSLADFLRYPHARPWGMGRNMSGRVIDEAVELLGKKLAPPFLVQNFLTIPYTITGSDLLAVLPLVLARAFAAQQPIQILEVPLRLPRMRYGAYWHERSHKDVGHKWLRSVVLQAAQGLQASPAAI